MTTQTKNIYDLLEEEINASDMSADERNKHFSALVKMRGQKINLMVVGATGAGKSSTINSIFNTSVAKVGVGVEPETNEIECYEFENLVIWDTPGLGEATMIDDLHNKMILEKLSQTDEEGNMLIDLVLVVLDASSKDMKTPLQLIYDVLLPCLGEKNAGRIMIGINQSDMAMKGNHWDSENNCPDEILKVFLEAKCKYVQDNILLETGAEIIPMYYCAGYTDDDGTQRSAYNLTKLLREILRIIPKEKRLAMVDTLNEDDAMWEYDDNEHDYIEDINESFTESVWDCVKGAADVGAQIGLGVIGIPGALVGGLLGGLFGCVKGLFRKVGRVVSANSAKKNQQVSPLETTHFDDGIAVTEDISEDSGIFEMPVSDMKEKYMQKWNEMGFDDEAIALAYDRTINDTGEFEWAYCDSLLQNWHARGLHSVIQIKDEDNT